LTVAASDIAVHREIFGEAGRYFDRFSHETAVSVGTTLVTTETDQSRLRCRSLGRISEFSWKAHTARILELCDQLTRKR